MSKPNWMMELEAEHGAEIANKVQAAELSACQQRILKWDAPKLWERIASSLDDARDAWKIPAIYFCVRPLTTHQRKIEFFGPPAAKSIESITVSFVPDPYRIEIEFETERDSITLFFTVAGGRVSLRDENGPLPDDEENYLADVVCERLLNPVLRSSLASVSSTGMQRPYER